MNKELIDGLRTGKYYVHCETEEEIREVVRIVESLFPEKYSDFREEWLAADRNWIRFQNVYTDSYGIHGGAPYAHSRNVKPCYLSDLTGGGEEKDFSNPTLDIL